MYTENWLCLRFDMYTMKKNVSGTLLIIAKAKYHYKQNILFQHIHISSLINVVAMICYVMYVRYRRQSQGSVDSICRLWLTCQQD